jgi:hypothetical protein
MNRIPNRPRTWLRRAAGALLLATLPLGACSDTEAKEDALKFGLDLHHAAQHKGKGKLRPWDAEPPTQPTHIHTAKTVAKKSHPPIVVAKKSNPLVVTPYKKPSAPIQKKPATPTTLKPRGC